MFLPTTVYSASSAELQTAYSQGQSDASKKYGECSGAADKDKNLGKSPDPSAASYEIVGTIINPYGASNRDLQDEWANGFVSKCSESYMSQFTYDSEYSGETQSFQSSGVCWNKGFSDGMNGGRPEPQKASDQLARSSVPFQKLSNAGASTEEKNEFIQSFSVGCKWHYTLGYEEFQKKSQEESAKDIIGSVQEDFDNLLGETEKKVTESIQGNTDQMADELGKSIGESIVPDVDLKSGGCLIATATYGTELAPQVQFMREIRDNTVLSTTSGAVFMTGFNQLYYSFSPTIADWERENPMFQEAVRAFITPMISTLSIMTLAEDGSEVQVLGLGISVIVLNLGMYIAIPAVIVWQVKEHI
ncbi:CFI-box-CTERM domain-containing protein [Nitrosopumilus sp.]|uniref:CFI-box-CTERM domain-containing protein n=1 Tax=Nitrosopumilus sp. TaxID=2024843 RepID=UPI002608EC0C|nr:CFI-box-CTERM domain-containing protein [Nitrosopumilus sp.]